MKQNENQKRLSQSTQRSQRKSQALASPFLCELGGLREKTGFGFDSKNLTQNLRWWFGK
jgi:hypothetical protein